LERGIENNHLLYANKEKSQELFSVLGLQFPKGLNNLDFNTIIHQSRNIVKSKKEKIDNEKSQELSMFQGLQLSEAFNNLDSDNIIQQNEDTVKSTEEKSNSYNDYKFTENSEGLTVKEYLGYDECVVIPAEVDGKKITTIGENSFANFSELKEVVIPQNVKQIDEGAFFYCENLQKVTLPNSLERISEDAFYNCDSLLNVAVPLDCEVHQYAFSPVTRLDVLADERTTTESSVEFTQNSAFFEAYGKDAETVSEVLGLTLMKRDGEPMVGIAGYAIDDCVSKLKEQGYSVNVNRTQQQSVSKSQSDDNDDEDEFVAVSRSRGR
jgi:hypothetical protein